MAEVIISTCPDSQGKFVAATLSIPWFIPAGNGRDLQAVDNEILQGMKIVPVRTVKEVLDIALA